MKLITLNVWGGHVQDPLLKFIESRSDIDIFCFQEVYKDAENKMSTDDKEVSLNIFSQIADILSNHEGFFRPVLKDSYGIGMFVKKDIEVLEEGDINIHDNPNYPGYGPTHPRNLQWVECRINKQIYSILNVHGLWNGMGKTDTPERIVQSQRIREFMDTINTPKIVCGDFNLRPDTKSLEIVEDGMTNLVKTYKVTSTRTSLYPKPERFADYIFTSPDITVNSFAVLPDEVSDHAPLFLDFN